MCFTRALTPLALPQKMNLPVETLYKALRETVNNQVKVSYQLISDHRQMVADAQAFNSKTVQALKATFASPDKSPTRSSVHVLVSNLPKAGEAPPAPPATKKKSRTKWHFGIRSRSAPGDIMLEIYRALKNVGMEWRTLDPYRLRALYVSQMGAEIRLELQLYCVEQDNYLLDFKNATPPKPQNLAPFFAREEDVPLNARRRSSVFGRPRSRSRSTGSRSHSTSRSVKSRSESQTDEEDEEEEEAPGIPMRPPTPFWDDGADEEDLVNLSAFGFFECCSRLIKELAAAG